ncbi:kinase-like domain-containing protein [Nemania sp. FL0031]|nr:kinase-like domain-containing protein [Nemania sp. FL0031]
MNPPSYVCDIWAEPLERYRPGGYHPILLGDLFHDQRYKVIQKLGWGTYSTTWVARDQVDNRNVALKVSMSEKSNDSEAHILSAISKLSEEYGNHPGRHHLVQMLDRFTVYGPNGTHDCLVLELFGPSVHDVVHSLDDDRRLPAELAKSTAYQVLLGLDFLSIRKIGHGYLHSNKIVFSLPDPASLDESWFSEKLGQPETAPVRSVDGRALTSHLPNYIVRPIYFKLRSMREGLHTSTVKIIDFGEAFHYSRSADALRTPMPVRAPETIFDNLVDYRSDMWSMACLLFELVAGQPPIDSLTRGRALLVGQMMEFCGEVPDRWRGKLYRMGIRRAESTSNPPYMLLEWLEKILSLTFNDNKVAQFTRQDLVKVCELVAGLMKFEPSSRASAKEIMNDPWFGGLKPEGTKDN